MDESGKEIRIITGGVMAAKGSKAVSTTAGIKYKDRQDVAMTYSQKPCRLAGTFTTNMVKAAPVKWDKNQVTSGMPIRAVVINAGIANACTGEGGTEYCGQTTGIAAQALGIPAEGVLVASTSVIGMQLPMDRIAMGVKAIAPLLDESLESDAGASRAIMTTDTKNKEVVIQFELRGNTVTMGGTCKGSGMIHPNMCIMLSFATTDAAISKELLQEALSQDIRDTYNTISVDGDTSANDIVLLLASGLAGDREVTGKGEDYRTFCRALKIVNETLAKKMAGGGEGCIALFEVKIVGTEAKEQARVLARLVICSSLTKAAIFGHGANWGKIFCVMGYSGARFDQERVGLYFESVAGKTQIIKDGVVVGYSEEQAARILSEPAITAVVDIKMGDAKATAWGCNPTFDYVRINVDYRS